MNITLIENGGTCCLAFNGSLTLKFVHQLENQIIDALRRYRFFEIDLSGVQVVKTSNIVLQAYERLASRRGTWLCASLEERALCAAGPATRSIEKL